MDNIKDEVFGTLLWDSEYECWTGKTEIRQTHSVEIRVYISEGNGVQILKSARHSFLKIREQESDLHLLTANAYLDVYNKTWNENDEDIDIASFVSLTKLETIVFSNDGTSGLYYDDGDLFAGHWIVAFLNPDGEFKYARLFG